MKAGYADIVASLQSDILRLEGFKPSNGNHVDLALGPMADSLPNGIFPLGAVHEFLTVHPQNNAATSGFLSSLLSRILANNGTLLWISCSRTLYPPAMKSFGIEPDRCIFIDLKKERDVLWALEEALKCGALSAVVGEIQNMSFTASRRLQLAVEKSQVTGFIVRPASNNVKPTACVSRWRISPLPSALEDLPGVGYPLWKVELLKIRNGRPGAWEIQWRDGKFQWIGEPNSANAPQAGDYFYQSKRTG